MRHVVWSLDQYVGIDIVPGLIERNSALYARANVRFACADIVADPLPSMDLVLCKDCFIHLPTRLIFGALANFQSSGARLLLLSNEAGVSPYHDIAIGSFRPIDFELPPFLFPPPLTRIYENSEDRQMCLWDLQAIPIPPRYRDRAWRRMSACS